jgi:hypothetical protein
MKPPPRQPLPNTRYPGLQAEAQVWMLSDAWPTPETAFIFFKAREKLKTNKQKSNWPVSIIGRRLQENKSVEIENCSIIEKFRPILELFVLVNDYLLLSYIISLSLNTESGFLWRTMSLQSCYSPQSTLQPHTPPSSRRNCHHDFALSTQSFSILAHRAHSKFTWRLLYHIQSRVSQPCITDKMQNIVHLRKGKVYFGSQFWRFQAIVGSVAFEPVARQHTMMGARGRRSCSPHGSQEAKSNTELLGRLRLVGSLFQGSPGKQWDLHCNQSNWVWWHVPVILAT